MEFKDKVREQRERLGMTQQELADALGYDSKSTVSKLEKGKMDLKQSQVKKLADVLRVSPSWLVCPDEPKFRGSTIFAEMTESYHELNEEGRKEALRMLRYLLSIEEYKEK